MLGIALYSHYTQFFIVKVNEVTHSGSRQTRHATESSVSLVSSISSLTSLSSVSLGAGRALKKNNGRSRRRLLFRQQPVL